MKNATIRPKVGDVVYKFVNTRTLQKLWKGKIIGESSDGDLVAEFNSDKEIVGWQFRWCDYCGGYIYKFLRTDHPIVLANAELDKQFEDEQRQVAIIKLKYTTKEQFLRAIEALDLDTLNKLQAAIKP